jgi:hypothetical protein
MHRWQTALSLVLYIYSTVRNSIRHFDLYLVNTLTMAKAFLHRLIAYLLLLYSFAASSPCSNPSPNSTTLLESPTPLPSDQTPVDEMAYPQTGYRSVAYFVVSHLISVTFPDEL